MAVNKNSSRDEIKAYQTELNKAGADPPLTVDGIWGPLTEAAHVSHGTEVPETSTDGSKLLLGGDAKLWYNTDTKEYWVVYSVPEVQAGGAVSGEIHTAWKLETDVDRTAVLGPGVDPVASFTGTTQDFTDMGVIDLGGVDELRQFDVDVDPFTTWVEDLSILAETRPWILDEDYIGLVVQASMERADGQISIDEIRTTKWWKEHTAAERAWMETSNGDPAEAERLLNDNRINIRTQLADAGINNATDDLVNYMADQVTTGIWSLPVLQSQVAALSDPDAVDTLNSGMVEFLGTSGYKANTTQGDEDTVRDLLQTWLGPVYGNWSNEDIAAKAGELRNDPDAQVNFEEYLKDQRMAVYPSYGDRNVSYQAAARPWETFLTSQWGTVPDHTDDVFQQIIQMNDPTEAGKLARQTGFDRGYEKVVNDVSNGISAGSRSNVIGAT